MAKQVSFGEKDTELIKRVVEFQKAQGLPTFVAAIRVLCESGLSIRQAVKKLK